MFTAMDLCLFVKKQGCNRLTSSFAMTTTAMFEVECAGWEYGLVKCVCVCVRKTFSTCEIIVLYKTLKWLHGWIARIIANNVRVNVPSSNRYVTDIVGIAASNDNIKHQWFCNHRALFCSDLVWFGVSCASVGRCTVPNTWIEKWNYVRFSVFCCYYWIRFWHEWASASLGCVYTVIAMENCDILHKMNRRIVSKMEQNGL